MAKKKTKKSVAAPRKVASAYVETFPIGDILDAPYNPREITDVALKGLSQALDTFGFLSLPVVNRRDEIIRLVGGHQRLRAAREDGATEVSCIVVEFDDAQERKANVALNNSAIEGNFIPELTRSLLADLASLTGNGAARMFMGLRFDALLKQVQRSITTEPGVDDVVVTGLTADDDLPGLGKSRCISKPSVVYQLGEHRLFCGKLTKVGGLDAFGVEEADVAFTRLFSPTPFADGYLDTHIGQVLGNVTGAIFLACNTDRLGQVHETFDRLGGHWSNTLLCYDQSAKPRQAKGYRQVAVPIVYGWRASNVRMWLGDRSQSNVIPFKSSPPKDDVTVGAVIQLLLLTVKKGGTVLDVNATKGTTLIAAEKTGRALIGYVPTAREMDRCRARWTSFVHGPDADWKAETGPLTKA